MWIGFAVLVVAALGIALGINRFLKWRFDRSHLVSFPPQRRTRHGAGKSPPMLRIDDDVLAQLPLTEISRVTFYKRDEMTTDLICCDVVVAGEVWSFHEELVGWDLLIGYLQRLPNFRTDWFTTVSQPVFATGKTIAFSR